MKLAHARLFCRYNLVIKLLPGPAYLPGPEATFMLLSAAPGFMMCYFYYYYYYYMVVMQVNYPLIEGFQAFSDIVGIDLQ